MLGNEERSLVTGDDSMRTRVLRREHKNGSIITVKLTKRNVIVEGTRNGIDVAIVKLKRERGWRDRFQVIVDNITGEKENNESAIQAQLQASA